MRATHLSSKLLSRPSVAGVLAIVAALLAAYVDWATSIEINVSVIYGLPLVLSVATRNRRLLWGLTAFLLLTTAVVYVLQVAPGDFSLTEHFFTDRALSAVTLLLIAALLHYRMKALDAMEAQRLLLGEQNEELDRRRSEAEDATQRKSHLLNSASHDLRTPVYAITLMAEAIRLAAEKPTLATQIPELVERLQTSALLLDGLIVDLLDISRFDSGRIVVHETTVSLDALLLEQCSNLRPLAYAKNLRLDLEAPARPVWLRTDRVKLARVVSNLLGNAIKFTGSGGIAVSANVTPQQVLIRVCDTGVGIAAENLDRIFDEFSQLENATNDRSEGWGLGLPICRRLIEALGGEITVQSDPGRGSTFFLSLPSHCLVDGPGTPGR